jgi:2-isopropylmalate synthase
MRVYDRQPYSGSLVFAAFSGSHQDAIAKGMKWREEKNPPYWNVPYLAIDPQDIGRQYDGDVIRINSQSGKGGIAYIMEQYYGLNMPPKMRESFGYAVKSISDHAHKELMPEEVYQIFKDKYVNNTAKFKTEEVHFAQKDGITASVTVNFGGKIINSTAIGNGRLDAVSNAIKDALGIEFAVLSYSEHALEVGKNQRLLLMSE